MPEYDIDTSDIVSQKEFKTQPSAGKMKLTHLWNAQGSILEHYQERNTAINTLQHNEILWDLLKPAIRAKCQGLLLKDVAQQCSSTHC
jgi:hypothetical protein